MRITKPLLLLSLLMTAPAAFANTLYDNTSQIDPSNLGFNIGGTNSGAPPTIGLSFFAPATDTVLNNFSLFLDAGTTGSVEGYIGSWDLTNGLVDSILYQSGPVALTGGAQTFTFAPAGGLTLVGDGSYIAFLSISFSSPNYNNFGGVGGAGFSPMPAVDSGDTIPGGQIQFIYDNGDPSTWTTQQWDSVAILGAIEGNDAAFQANFSANAGGGPSVVPEPGSLLLLGTGLAGLAGALRRQRARQPKAA